ncbi:MAG: arsenic transporter [Deltaproteobacteria bacterium]|nr:MAG: arsenic transporter [Deltaproteobacteria bacterium]
MLLEKEAPRMTQTIEKVEDLFRHRILLVTGKGGVGKTTVAASLARMAAATGKRTLALDMERDLNSPSHILKALGGPSSFDQDEPYQLTAHLSCARLSARAGHEIFLRDNIPFAWLATAAMRSKYLQRFLGAVPGFQEMGIMYRMLPYLRAKDRNGAFEYDLLVADLPATGHALALTSMPEPMLNVFDGGPMARAIREAQSYFNDPVQTGFVVVTLPEPLVVSETLELLDGLHDDEVKPAGLFVNNLPQYPWSSDEKDALDGILENVPPNLAGVWSYRHVERTHKARKMLGEKLKKYPSPVSMFCLGQHNDVSPKQRVAAILEELWSNAPCGD